MRLVTADVASKLQQWSADDIGEINVRRIDNTLIHFASRGWAAAGA